MVVAWSSSDENASSYVLPVLWMTSRLGPNAWSLRRSQLFTVTGQVDLQAYAGMLL